MIILDNLTKQYGKLSVLNQLSVEFNSGECVALIGPNGCGKTTLIKSILGMVVPNAGNILFKNKTIKNDVTYRNYIGYMPQIGRYPDNMTIGQVLEMIKSVRKYSGELDLDLYHAFAIEELLNKKMRTLSGGTTQKVSAVLAFLFNPELLILDEPTAGLDPIASEVLKEKIIKEKQKGKLILITSHILSELDELVSHITLMHEGKVRFKKSIHELKEHTNQPNLAKAITHILKEQ
ncbi:MAG: ABC transporter ATP-binding protein [Bacteroidia bacterium]|nr:ABC transporter ATP-binding protein [Bacteroidia bacterium]MCZ2140398.1 ABC transporter ATP-binding protein [Bacteroidia bacterium]